jgi:2-iminobutanoate/2-iminopropanoate deaminase
MGRWSQWQRTLIPLSELENMLMEPGYAQGMAGVYEHARDAGPFVFIAGQTPQPRSGDTPKSIEDQVDVAIAKIVTLLSERDLELADVVKMTYYLTDLADLPGVRVALDRALPHPRPAATLVEVSGLIDPLFRIEIEAVAFRG